MRLLVDLIAAMQPSQKWPEGDTSYRIVLPNYREPEVENPKIAAALDYAIMQCPEAAKDRDELYGQLATFYGKYRYIPEFVIKPRE